MILKIFKAVWFVSLLAVLANLFYVYAGLPEQVQLFTSGGEWVEAGKEPLFYTAMVTIGVFNLLVYLFSVNVAPSETFRSWLHGQIITLNIFFIITLSLIGLYNSAEHFDYSRIGGIVYASVALVLVWALSWPFIWLWQNAKLKK
ncbi:MAG: hypothetical protein N2044_05160 [Cyclobacteriaceae bacterium]|nr:hypothetical protein [Cyclobacteriaceae bacterium]MCX7637219.1 hypothetical protein [Cyclobacteriaceae bacterium]MDW8332087.1 hypothetical protein [Cyclobacteriaceae bacterium]